MAVMRFVSFGLMILASLMGLWLDPYDGAVGSDASLTESKPLSPYISSVAISDFSHFGLMFSTALFSQLFQHSVPGLMNPLPETKKKKSTILTLFSGALGTTLSLYLVMGLACSLYFGPSLTSKSINVNFNHFTWGSIKPSQLQQAFINAINALIVLFPAVNTLSVFPLMGVTLGNNFASFFPKLAPKLKK